MESNKEIFLDENSFLTSETDSQGDIIHANEEFCELSEYSLEELIGKNNNILRDPNIPDSIFIELWETIKNGDVWSGCIKNKTKSGGYYWMYVKVYPFTNEKNDPCYLLCGKMATKEMIEDSKELYNIK
jgi:aerotaxis receptor